MRWVKFLTYRWENPTWRISMLIVTQGLLPVFVVNDVRKSQSFSYTENMRVYPILGVNQHQRVWPSVLSQALKAIRHHHVGNVKISPFGLQKNHIPRKQLKKRHRIWKCCGHVQLSGDLSSPMPSLISTSFACPRLRREVGNVGKYGTYNIHVLWFISLTRLTYQVNFKLCSLF